MSAPILTCPECGETRLTRQMQAAVSYLVAYAEHSPGSPFAEMVEPADVVDGHTQYEITGADQSIFCTNLHCQYDSDDVWDFIPQEEED